MADNVDVKGIFLNSDLQDDVNMAGDIHVAGISSDEEEISTLDEPVTVTLVGFKLSKFVASPSLIARQLARYTW